MAGVPLPTPPSIDLSRVKDPVAREALNTLLMYLDTLRRRIEQDYT